MCLRCTSKLKLSILKVRRENNVMVNNQQRKTKKTKRERRKKEKYKNTLSWKIVFNDRGLRYKLLVCYAFPLLSLMADGNMMAA